MIEDRGGPRGAMQAKKTKTIESVAKKMAKAAKSQGRTLSTQDLSRAFRIAR